MNYTGEIKSVLFGVAVGDALGVPVEFRSRKHLKENPVTDMIGHGTHNQPPGTWSDDSSLTFCLAEALAGGFSLQNTAGNFVKWMKEDYWTPHGTLFDIGTTTSEAINWLARGIEPEFAGLPEESSNGNGSLMRISPLVFHLSDQPINKRFKITKQVSSMTHRHIRSVIACFYYLEFGRRLLEQKDKVEIYKNLQTEITKYLTTLSISAKELFLFDRLLKENIWELSEEKIQSSGYVMHTIEASIWCLLSTDNYKDSVLKAVNLGDDTDTTGAVTGGLAGLLYGYDAIPDEWINALARQDDIEALAERFSEKLTNA